ncbi:MAG TPA: hypothetical protein VKB35_17880, partial [Ktedonobacteraceae bacterium]|nr:hypothetical protein [Ktedonobacteraceae bacterium]
GCGAQAPLSGREHGVVELPPDLQVRAHAGGLPGIGEERQFDEIRRCLRSGGLALLGVLVPH